MKADATLPILSTRPQTGSLPLVNVTSSSNPTIGDDSYWSVPFLQDAKLPLNFATLSRSAHIGLREQREQTLKQMKGKVLGAGVTRVASIIPWRGIPPILSYFL